MSDRACLRLSTLTLLLTYLVILLGAATRVYDAGVSCPDWPHCYGVWNPFDPANMPPGGYVSMGVHYQWWQVALEWTHRLLVSVVGGLMLLMALMAPRRPRHEWGPLAVAVLLLFVQVGLGGLTVLKGNVNWSVAIPLGTAMLLFGALAWHRRAVAAGPPPYNAQRAPGKVAAMAVALPALALLLMMVGAFVSSSHAGGICGGLFSCDGQWWPADLGQHVHMLHRYLAVTLLLASGLFVGMARNRARWLTRGAQVFHRMVWVQAGLGVATLYSFTQYPGSYEYLSLAHLAWGTLVWMIGVGVALTLRYGTAGRFHD